MTFGRIKSGLILSLTLSNVLLHSEISDRTIRLSNELKIEKIDQDVYVVIHSFPWPANSMLVRCTGNVLVWVDTPYTDETAGQVLDWIQTEFGMIRIVEINTGYHNDNLGGNGCLSQNGIEIYGSDLTARLLKKQSEKMRAQTLALLQEPKFKKYYDAHAAAVYTEPNHLFEIDKGLNLMFGKDTVEVFYPGPSHTEDNVVVYFPSKKLLFGGCMVKSIQSNNLGNTLDADMKQWPVSLKKVLDKFGDARIVVPGHGPAGGIELIEHSLKLFEFNEK
jgi:metallo-beta-lactamase class B